MNAPLRHRLPVLFAGVLFAIPAGAPALGDDEISSLESRYKQALDLARQPIKTLEVRYVEELKKLAERVQKSGDLDGALLVRDEIENFVEERPRDFSIRPELARLRAVYEESLARFEAEVLGKQADIARQTVEQLETLRDSLTQAGDLDQALRADTRRKELAEEWAQISPGSARSGLMGHAGGGSREEGATVRADRNRANPLNTRVELKAGNRYQIIPDPRDRWGGGGSKRNETCDYQGYPGSRVNWMRMFSMLGDRAPVPVDPEEVLTAAKEGTLYLFAEDNGPDDNTGRIRARIVVNPDPSGL